MQIYSKSTGIPVDSLDMHSPISEIADSITFMRVRDTLRKSLGFTLYIEEMAASPNIVSQIRLLKAKGTQTQNIIHRLRKRVRSPALGEMNIEFGSQHQTEKMKTAIGKTINTIGFDWANDVADIIPVYDYMHAILKIRGYRFMQRCARYYGGWIQYYGISPKKSNRPC
jgi:hypothetical protein